MAKPRAQATTDPMDDERSVPDDAVAEPSIWDALSDEDRASLLSALARSRAGVFASDEEVEAAWAAFGLEERPVSLKDLGASGASG